MKKSIEYDHNKSETSMHYSFSIMTPIRKEEGTEEFSLGFCGYKCNVTCTSQWSLKGWGEGIVQNANFGGYQSFYAKITIFSIIVAPQSALYAFCFFKKANDNKQKELMICIVDENVFASMLRHSRSCLHRIVYSSEKTRGEDVSTVWHFCRRCSKLQIIIIRPNI